jgi:HAD superfamily hydrolase (TIGR01509 family)
LFDPSETPLAIFDHDGVLVDSFELHVDSWLELARRTGLPITRGFLHETFGMTNPAIFGRLLGRELPAEQLAAYAELKESCYRERARDRLTLMPGVRDLLDALTERDARLAIGSSGPLANLELTVEVCGLSGRFAAIASLEDVSRGKPDPQVFLVAARKAGCRPERAVVFEDAIVGVQAARAAGMLAVGVGSSRPLDELIAAGADVAVPDLVGFPAAAWVDRLRERA